MPLPFESLSHGTIAFGFFNIDSDMLLLEKLFFFADDFCRWISDLSVGPAQGKPTTTWSIYRIEKKEDIGDLTGAIHGYSFSGFIGDTYKKFPFPKNPDGFKQKSNGFETRAVIAEMIEKYAASAPVTVFAARDDGSIKIDDYVFSTQSFQGLVRYVWRGGYPRWENDIRPDYVVAMKNTLEKSAHWLFEGLSWDV